MTIVISSSALANNIKLQSEVYVGGRNNINIKLSDIVKPSLALIDKMSLLSEIKFAEIQKNKRKLISRYEIVDKLKKIKSNYPELKDLNFVIPQKVKVVHVGFELTSRVVSEGLKRLWQKQCYNCKFVIDQLALPELAGEHLEEEWYIKASSSLPNGRFTAQIIYPKINDPKTIWITGQANTRKPVAVVNRNVSKGELVDPAWIKVAYKDVSKVQDALLDLNHLKNKVTNRYLMTGDVIKSTHLIEKVLFNRGDAVKLVYNESGLRIVTSAIAESLGKIGKSVWVKNIKSKKRISGVVLNTGEVLIQ